MGYFIEYVHKLYAKKELYGTLNGICKSKQWNIL